jgi:hypothetical protein
MATNSSSHPARAGFNQSGGAYFLVISSIAGQLNAFTVGTGSGGATTAGTFAPVTTLALLPGVGNQSSLFGVGNLIKDLGKTVVSSGRTFRKFQLVQQTASNSSITGGITGPSPTYASFYLETGRDGAGAAAGALPRIARYF